MRNGPIKCETELDSEVNLIFKKFEEDFLGHILDRIILKLEIGENGMDYDAKLKPNELSGKSTKLGEVIVSYKVPKKLRSEVAYHERVENKELTKRK